jgi:hypothetical protein
MRNVCFIVCVALYAVLFVRGVLLCVMCFICVLCLIVLSLQRGKTHLHLK